MKTICGLDCSPCPMKGTCGGCAETNGHPFDDRCYGLTADENHLLVCEYGENGSDPEIIVYQKRK